MQVSFHQLHQLSVAVYDVVFHLVRRDFGEEFAGTFNFAIFDLAQFHGGKGAFGFGDKVNVFYGALLEGNGPVWAVIANRCRDLEGFGELRVHHDFSAGVEFTDKFAFDPGIGKDVVVNVAVRFEAFTQVFFPVLGEDVDAVRVFKRIVGEVLDNDGGLLFVDEPARF